MQQTVMKTHQSAEYAFNDFADFHALTRNPVVTNKLIQLYQEIFAEADGWNEHYSYAEVYQNLKHETVNNAHLRACHETDTNEVIGFCWAQLQSLQQVCQAITTVQHYERIGSPDVYTPLRNLMGDEPVIYLHDLGIKRELRGKLPLNQLIYPVLHGVAEKTGINRVLFWTIANTNVSKLARRGGFELVMLHSGMQFYAGEIK